MTALTQLIKHLQLPVTPEQYLQAQRLFHGRGHAYPGLHHVTVDWLPPVVLISLFAPEPRDELDSLAETLLTLLPTCESLQLQHRYHLSGPVDVIHGESIEQITVLENNLRFHIQLGKSRNTGLFLDMRNGRQWVQQHCRDKRVLNLFAYTCGFSVTAVAGGARSVLNVDMSGSALSTGRKNHRLNQQSLETVNFEKLNIFKSFGRLKRRGPFDLLICDPPTLQKGSVDIARDYPKIMRRLDEFMAPGSTLLLCLNAPELAPEFMIEHMQQLAPHYQFVEQIPPPKVFIDSEGEGMKVLAFKAS